MNATELIVRARVDGVILRAGTDGLKAKGNRIAVQHWLPTLKLHKPELLAELTLRSTELEGRIRRMAARWRYTASDLAEALQLAADDPEKWERAVALDERREAEFRAKGLLRDA